MTGMRGIFFLFIVVLQHNWCMAVECPTISATKGKFLKLSEDLLSTCTEIEDETKPRRDELEFASSTYYLYQLGQWYIQKAIIGLGSEIEQKHNFTRAAALFYGAKMRYDTFLAVLLAPTTENNDALQSCLSQMEKAYFRQVIIGWTETIKQSIQRRNPISKCITMIQLHESLLATKDRFLDLLEDRETTYPWAPDNVEYVLTKMNLSLPHGRNIEAVRCLSGNLTCLRKDISSMLNHLLSTISGSLSDISDVTIEKDPAKKLEEASNTIKSDLRSKREKGKQELEQELKQRKSTMINDKHIESVNNILRQNTKKYNQLFKKISEECIKIIGKPPTKYAVISFGSTSRKEVTLYSDFEHAILYRPTTETTKNQVKEYYLWYTVLFHITVISLEETMIHAVNFTTLRPSIPLLNDYYDAFTPRGIAFDSMVKGGNKNPFRQGEFHLILNVDYTKLYVGSEQMDITNLLARSSFAFGDDTIYTEFALKVNEAMKNRGTIKILQDQVGIIDKTDRGIISGKDHSNLAKRYEDPKNSLYRPLTVFLELFARVYRYSDESTDEFIQWLKSKYAKQRWEKETFLTLRYDLALASEVRLKVYSAYGRQMYEVSKEEIFDVINKTEYVRMFTEIVLLRNTIRDLDRSCRYVSLNSSFPNPMPSFQVTELTIMRELPKHFKTVGKLSDGVQEELTKIERFTETVMELETDGVYIEWRDYKDSILEIFANILLKIDVTWGTKFDKMVRLQLSGNTTGCLASSSKLAAPLGAGGAALILFSLVLLFMTQNT